MERLSPFDCISPLDYRYYATKPAVFERLSPYLCEAARVRYEARVEAALVQAFAARGICSEAIAAEVTRACEAVTVEEVALEEARVVHNTRALVNCIRNRVAEEGRRFVHLGLTSYDVVDTATALRLRDVTRDALIPELVALEKHLIALALREKATPQIGRTHGQFAVPITFGFAVAGYVSRLGTRIETLRAAAENLRGKIAGAVGAYNALSLLLPDPMTFEVEVLARLGLKPGSHSTQIVAAEYLTDHAHAVASTLGVLANLADDMRHLQRSEIGEVGEAVDPAQVGSSTMPHKRNPETFETVKGIWKAFAPRMLTVYLDQISEHQRDLSNSASQRFVPELVAALAVCAMRLNRVVARLVVDREAMARNLANAAPTVVAEPLYIVLAAAGHPDAHEAVRRLTREAEEKGLGVMQVAEARPELRPYLERLTAKQAQALRSPESYLGLAAEKAEAVCKEWQERLGLG